MNKTIKSVTGPVVAAATLVGVCTLLLEPTLAQAEQLTMVTKPYKEVIIRGYARWNSNCDALLRFLLMFRRKTASFARGLLKGLCESFEKGRLATVWVRKYLVSSWSICRDRNLLGSTEFDIR